MPYYKESLRCCLIVFSLLEPQGWESQGHDLYLAEAEKSDLTFLLSQTFSFLIWVFLHIHFFLAHKNTLLCIFPFVFVRPHMYFPCRYNIHTTYIMFFWVLLCNFSFLCFPSIFMILVLHRCPIFHWIVTRRLLCFGFWIVIVMTVLVYRAYFFW